MTLANSAAQRADWVRRADRIQLEIADLRLRIDNAMRTNPKTNVQKLLAMADVHLENASQELSVAASNVHSVRE